MPVGYTLSFGGDTEDQVEVFSRIIFALGVAVMLMYLILVVQFGSFLDPLAILLSLPLSLIGVVLGLWLAGSTLNLMSMIGIIMLMGIVAKNAILLVDFAKWGKERGLDRREALIEAGAIRLRPILMTTFALIAGMLPVALGKRRGRAVPGAHGHRHHRRRDHLHAADAAGDPHRVGAAGRDARELPGPLRRQGRRRQGRPRARRAGGTRRCRTSPPACAASRSPSRPCGRTDGIRRRGWRRALTEGPHPGPRTRARKPRPPSPTNCVGEGDGTGERHRDAKFSPSLREAGEGVGGRGPAAAGATSPPRPKRRFRRDRRGAGSSSVQYV